MRIVTNPGSNLSSAQLARYDIVLTPQQVMADGVSHPTKSMSGVAEIDRIVQGAKTHPHVLGTSAAEFVTLVNSIGPRDPDIIIVTTSRKVIGTYDAAIAAARTLATFPAFRNVSVSVVDSMLGDVAAGYLSMFCAESAKAGKSPKEIVAAARSLAEAGRLVMIPTNLDNLVKSGRATFLRSMAATLLQKLPVLHMAHGEFGSVGTISRSAHRPTAIVDHLVGEVPPRGKMFVGIAHAYQEAAANELLALLRQRYDVHCAMIREWSPAIYLNVGNSVGAFVIPLDAAPWIVNVAV